MSQGRRLYEREKLMEAHVLGLRIPRGGRRRKPG